MQQADIVRASDVSFNEGALRLAAVHHRVAEFRYAKTKSSPIETRRFIPESVAQTSKGDIVIIGPDEDREHEFRSYRLDRIKGDVKIP